MKPFENIATEIIILVHEWEPKLLLLPEEMITQRRNSQNRTIKQILGHMVDSASNTRTVLCICNIANFRYDFQITQLMETTTAGLPFRITRMKTGKTWFSIGNIQTCILHM